MIVNLLPRFNMHIEMAAVRGRVSGVSGRARAIRSRGALAVESNTPTLNFRAPHILT